MSAFPALGFDPAPGDAAEVGRLGRETARVAGELHDLDRELQRLGSVGPAWRGAAGECFRGAVGELPVHLRRAEDSFAVAARALSTWGDLLADLQVEARAAERAAADALARLRAARARAAEVPTGGADPAAWVVAEQAAARAVREAEADLERARARGRHVQEQAQEGAFRAEHAVREAARTAPPEPGLLERIGDSLVDGVRELNARVGEWVKENAELIAAITDAVSVVAFVAGFVPGVGTGVMLALNGAVLVSTVALAAYTDEKGLTDVAFAGVGLGLGVLGAGAGRAAAVARAEEMGTALAPLPSMFTPGLVMGQRELVWRSVQLQPVLAGHALGLVDTVRTGRDRGLIPAAREGAA